VESRPAIVYAIVHVVGVVALWWFEWKYGMKLETIGELCYLIRIPSRTSPQTPTTSSDDHHLDNTPILFLHGLGIGPCQHFIFINKLLSDRHLLNRIVFIPIQPYVSQHVLHPRHVNPPGRDEILRDLCALIWRVGEMQKGMEMEKEKEMKVRERGGERNREKKQPRVTVISHSNGTALHAWLVKSHPELVYRSCFVDPVIFCLWEGDVCYNFVYKTPSNGQDVLVNYFVSSEMGIANYIQRNFDWSANTLFFEEIPNPHIPYHTLIFVSTSDSILSAKRVSKYFAWHGLTEESDTIYSDQGAVHGEAIVLGGKGLKVIMDWLRANGGGGEGIDG